MWLVFYFMLKLYLFFFFLDDSFPIEVLINFKIVEFREIGREHKMIYDNKNLTEFPNEIKKIYSDFLFTSSLPLIVMSDELKFATFLKFFIFLRLI